MRKLMTLLAVLVAFTLVATPAFAGKGTKANKGDKSVKGTIESVAADGGSLVLQTGGKKKAGGTQTITINASTTIEINGQSGKHASDLQSGTSAVIKMSNGAASDISVGASGKHHKKKNAA
jgi:hypothetical protein